MKIHVYDIYNQRKIGQVDGSDFLSLKINQNIDDFNSCVLEHGINRKIADLNLQGFENFYIEDYDGNIIFGGIMASYSVSSQKNTLNLLDHRWVLSRLVLDSVLSVSAGDDIIDTVESLMNQAIAKRSIPLVFDREGSAFNEAFTADLRFEVGDNVASSIQKIIQTVYARWAVQYVKVGNDFIGKLRVRSVRGVTPEGVGVARGYYTNETGEIVTMLYKEGGRYNSILDFNLTYDLTNYASRTKVGAKINGVTSFVTASPSGNSAFFENTFGRTEGYTTDYNIDSAVTASAVSVINQVFPRIDINVVLNPKYQVFIKPGDRVNLQIESELLKGVNGNLVRVDSVSYDLKDGYLERSALLNFVSPQIRAGTIGLLEQISRIDSQLDGLNKNYLTT